MDKLRGSGIILCGSVDEGVIRRMIADSYDLTDPCRSKQYTEDF